MNNLRAVRTEKGISQLELSAKTRISPGVISNLEYGKIFAYKGWKKRLSNALGVSEKEIFPEVVADGKHNSKAAEAVIKRLEYIALKYSGYRKEALEEARVEGEGRGFDRYHEGRAAGFKEATGLIKGMIAGLKDKENKDAST